MKRFADVILPLPLSEAFTYLLPPEMEQSVSVGSRVIVPFGKKKFYTAIVIRLHEDEPQGYTLKPITELLDSHPIILPSQLRLWQWIAEYYMCTLGDVYKAALPSGLKLESESSVEINEDYEASAPLGKREQSVLDLLSVKSPQSIAQLSKESGVNHLLPTIKSLMEKGAILVKEELRRNYKEKVETRVRLTPNWTTERALSMLLDTLRRAPKQQQIVMDFVELSDWTSDCVAEVTKKQLLEKSGATSAVFNSLVSKGVFETYDIVIGRIADGDSVRSLNPLSEAQQTAFDGVVSSFREKNVTLLHGVTSSGKTEVYIHLIEKTLAEGKQVLYLLPEIALTTQITDRLAQVFGGRMGVYHSKYPDAERVEIWQKQLSDSPYQLILGVRSSIFLPFSNLGLIIVDEEHETSYKQQDPAPRYHARNVAIVLAHLFGAKTLLGTATPSIETYYNAREGKYGLVTLSQRYQGILLPEIQIVDISELRRKKMMSGPFSPELLALIRKALAQKEQVILFQNRRGFAPMVECRTCGWVPKCTNCDVSLTYHKSTGMLTCHYCGHTYRLVDHCPSCNETNLRPMGYGTEKIEEAILEVFPEARVARMDLDTTRTRSAYERIISDFEDGRTDILIGTQMISKGLDFDRVSVVGILNADTMLNQPDFRAYERAFQMMSQVAGRAGRKHRQGLVVLQTKSPGLPVISQVVRNDYDELYEDQMSERQLFSYPPFHRLVYVYLKSKDRSQVEHAATDMAAHLRAMLGERILGPDAPAVARVQTMHIRKIVVKVELAASMKKVRDLLQGVRAKFQQSVAYHSVIIYYDVDPF